MEIVQDGDAHSRENADAFVEKAARSLSEIQSNVNNLGDVLVFLEVLGYNDAMAQEHNFADLADMARAVLKSIGYYESHVESNTFTLTIPSLKRRVFEAIALASPWVGAWSVLLAFGVSLWLSARLPIEITTAFMLGVFLGLLISGGQLQGTGRLLSMYKSQANIGEVKRILRRNYLLLSIIIIAAISGVYGIATLTGTPRYLIAITMISTASLTLHLSSYTLLYVLRKIWQILASYAAALAMLVIVYYELSGAIPNPTLRYFVGLGSAFLVLSVSGIYYHLRIFLSKDSSLLSSEVDKRDDASQVDPPSFYNPVTTSTKTISSNFHVQIWETIPYYIFGMFFVSMLFGDRVISWAFNPHLISGTSYPLLFNTAYHVGADTALLVLFPAMIVQYVMMGPVYEHVHNMSLSAKVTEAGQVDFFLQQKYKQVLVATLTTSCISASLVISLAPRIVALLGGSSASAHILFVAALSNILMSIFGANALFLSFLNRIRSLAVIVIAGTIFVGVVGIALGLTGFQNVVYAYLGMSMMIVILSYAEVSKYLRRVASIHLAKFV
jgi:hypothetical protein